jgi:Predicted AAA-ATPase/PD-(D/E)XK nuclease superfamily
LKKLPVGIQTFSEIIRENQVYVDKTELIQELLEAGKYFFFSRPRRFGKSLLLDTIHEIFEGNQALFKGLWLENQRDWTKKNPVIRLDFNRVITKDAIIEETLYTEIQNNATRLKVELSEKKSPSSAFRELLLKLSQIHGDGSIVLLVDEYDKALVDYLDNQETFAYNQDLLRGFYTNIKAHDKAMKFVLLMGVSKIGKLSLFSGLNNITDISLDTKFANICGISQNELNFYFEDYIKTYANKHQKNVSEVLSILKNWYNGYSWNSIDTLYNPYSLLNFFRSQELRNYWFETGTPTILTKMIRANGHLFDNFKNFVVGSDLSLSTFDVQENDDIGLMFQTGYLTIKSIVEFWNQPKVYQLGFPNQEVEYSFAQFLLAEYIKIAPSRMSHEIAYPMTVALHQNDIPTFVEYLKSSFARIPYQLFIEKEAFYHSMLLMLMISTGMPMRTEESSAGGRSDLVIETPERIFIFEFKIDKTAKEAIEQILSRGYQNPYMTHKKGITIIGINFSERQLSDFEVQEIK